MIRKEKEKKIEEISYGWDYLRTNNLDKNERR